MYVLVQYTRTILYTGNNNKYNVLVLEYIRMLLLLDLRMARTAIESQYNSLDWTILPKFYHNFTM